MRENLDDKKTEMVFGRGPVLEVIENSNLEINKIYLSNGLQDKALKNRIIDYAKEKKVPYFIVPPGKISNLSDHKNHQGVLLTVSPIKYLSLNELIENSKDTSVILVAHEIEDVHNLGALIRTFVASGGRGVVLTGRKHIGINATVIKTSAGTLFQSQFARAVNCSQTIKKLQENDFWVVGADSSLSSQSLYEIDFPNKIAIVVGNEHEGLGELIKKNCDFLARIPISSKVDSLNVSVAFGIILFEFLRQKH